VKRVALLLLASIGGPALGAGPTPDLPPTEVVARVLRGNPGVQAAASQIRVEEANRTRLEAGAYEWSVRLGAQQRRVSPVAASSDRFNEWNAALERPFRLPGKAGLDAELGAAGVSLAETAYGDTLHESSRMLLKAWFSWLKESAAASQWDEQVALLDKQTRSVGRRQQLGDAARIETIQSEAAMAQAEAQRVQARIRQQIAGEDLRRRFPGLPIVAPAGLSEPTAISGSDEEWINRLLEHSHEYQLARQEAQRAQIMAGRSSRSRRSACMFRANGPAKNAWSAPMSAFRYPAPPGGPVAMRRWPRPRWPAAARPPAARKSWPKPSPWSSRHKPPYQAGRRRARPPNA